MAPVDDMQESGVEIAMSKFSSALENLERIVNLHLEGHRSEREAEEEVQRVNADRAELAESLDRSEARAVHLESINKEVSHRLVAVMESIRNVVSSKS